MRLMVTFNETFSDWTVILLEDKCANLASEYSIKVKDLILLACNNTFVSFPILMKLIEHLPLYYTITVQFFVLPYFSKTITYLVIL